LWLVRPNMLEIYLLPFNRFVINTILPVLRDYKLTA